MNLLKVRIWTLIGLFGMLCVPSSAAPLVMVDLVTGPPVYHDPQGPPAYDLDSIGAKIGEIFGPDAQAEFVGLTNSDTGTVDVGEIFSPATLLGDSDLDTILINTKDTKGNVTQSLTTAAMVCWHETIHVRERKNASPPSDEDPTTNVLPCGSCAHALDYLDQAHDLIAYCFSDAEEGHEQEEADHAIDQAIGAAKQAAQECYLEGCDFSTFLDTLNEINTAENGGELCPPGDD